VAPRRQAVAGKASAASENASRLHICGAITVGSSSLAGRRTRRAGRGASRPRPFSAAVCRSVPAVVIARRRQNSCYVSSRLQNRTVRARRLSRPLQQDASSVEFYGRCVSSGGSRAAAQPRVPPCREFVCPRCTTPQDEASAAKMMLAARSRRRHGSGTKRWCRPTEE